MYYRCEFEYFIRNNIYIRVVKTASGSEYSLLSIAHRIRGIEKFSHRSHGACKSFYKSNIL